VEHVLARSFRSLLMNVLKRGTSRGPLMVNPRGDKREIAGSLRLLYGSLTFLSWSGVAVVVLVLVVQGNFIMRG
jgi:hypothetical protein